MSSKKPVQTIADVARLANVSKSTVSRALNDSPLIGDETKERIRAIAAMHNFQLNAPARRLSLKQSRTIGYVTHCYHKEFSVADLFGLEINGGITRTLSANGYDMLEIHVDPRDTDWARQYLDSGRVDGFILMTFARKQAHIQALLDIGAPFIVWGVSPENNRYSTVSGDNFNGGRLATEYLIRSGRQRIAFMGGPANQYEVQQRYSGYEEALRAAGRPIDQALITYGDYSLPSGGTGIQKLLEQAPNLDAAFVNSDLMAITAINALRESGRRVPDDVAVVGYDDLSIAEIYYPPLTTIRQNVPLAGKLLAQNLIQNLQTGVVTNVTVPVELVVRKSA
ncbi:MAG TPA: LacI family DNA-binding transcriptional regulator [Anaerolineaceae bacterium]|nr:LacI family DNA-binding transcriptional regulator [Anaerolineaceae bacterium]